MPRKPPAEWSKETILRNLQELPDYVEYAREAIEREDWNDAESNLSMLCDDAGEVYAAVEIKAR